MTDHLPITTNQSQLRDRAARVLENGFRVAAVIMAVGLLLSVIQQEGLESTLSQPADVAQGIADGNPGSIIGLGILAIILTPFVSTLVIALTFARQGDRRYALISGLVLLILCVSIALSLL